MIQELKDMLKPPFIKYGNSICDSSGGGTGRKLLLKVPDFLMCEDTERVLYFTVAALNEKWDRDFGDNKLKLKPYKDAINFLLDVVEKLQRNEEDFCFPKIDEYSKYWIK